MAFSLVLFCWIQNSTWNCHEVQLFQFVKLKIIPQPNLLAAGSSLHFAKGSEDRKIGRERKFSIEGMVSLESK
jgi:hypothetical protein